MWVVEQNSQKSSKMDYLKIILHVVTVLLYDMMTCGK